MKCWTMASADEEEPSSTVSFPLAHVGGQGYLRYGMVQNATTTFTMYITFVHLGY